MARSAFLKILIVAIVTAAMFTWVFGMVLIRGTSMEPTMGDGDVALYYRPLDGLQADDIVVYRGDSGRQLVGRVVAQPGDTVEVTREGVLMLNGAEQPAISSGVVTLPSDSGPSYPLTLAEGEFFVLGDGRTNAVDSRELGPIGVNEVEGKVIALLRLRGI